MRASRLYQKQMAGFHFGNRPCFCDHSRAYYCARLFQEQGHSSSFQKLDHMMFITPNKQFLRAQCVEEFRRELAVQQRLLAFLINPDAV